MCTLSANVGKRATLIGALVVSVTCWNSAVFCADGSDASTKPAADRPAGIWKPGAVSRILPGVVATPAELPNIGRWQVIRVVPRCHMFSIAWSPDGTLFAHTDGTYVRISDSDRREIQAVLVGHTGSVKSVEWSPDGKQIATAGDDGTVRLWNADGSPKRVLEGHTGRVNSVCWSPSGEQVSSASSDGTVRIWNVSGTPGPVILKGHKSVVRTVDWSPDGKRLVSGGDDNYVRIWTADGTAGPVCKGHFGPISAVAWSPDSTQIVSASIGSTPKDEEEKPVATVRFWSVDGKPGAICRGHYRSVTDVVWSPGGKVVATTCEDQRLRFWSTDGVERASVSNVRGYAVDWSADGSQIAVVGRDWLNVFRVDRIPGRFKDVSSDHYIRSVAWSPSGEWIASTDSKNKIRIWHLDGRAGTVIDGKKLGIKTMTWSPDGKTIAAGGEEKVVQLWSPGGTAGQQLTGLESRVDEIAWSPDGKWIAASGEDDPSVRLWRPDGKAGPVLEGLTKSVMSMAWSPDGKQLASGGGDGSMTLWDIADGAFLDMFEGKHGDVDTIDWSPDGKMLAVGGDGVWTLWSVDGERLSEQTEHVDAVMGLAFSPDGKFIASAGWDHTVRLWSPDGKQVRLLKGHTAPAYAVSWRPDSKRLVSCGVDGTIHVWNVETGIAEWSSFYLQKDRMMTLSAAGQVLEGEPAAIEKGLRYLVEKPNGAMEIIRYSEFLERIQAGSSK